MSQIGDAIPGFILDSDSGESVSASGLMGRRYVLYFYPKDDTPGCTIEACQFRDNLPFFGNLGVPVFGVSPDPVKSHGKFKKKFDLNFPLLSDPDRTVIDPLGLWVEKTFMGRKYMGVARTTVIVDKTGKIEHIFSGVKPDGHPEEVLAYLNAPL